MLSHYRTMNPRNNHLPFSEPEGYVSRLLQQSTQQALHSQRQQRPQHALHAQRAAKHAVGWHWAAASCACIVLAVGALWIGKYDGAQWLSKTDEPQSPLDAYFASLTDAEAADLFYYEVKEIIDDEY